jgi:hypothetical protein
MIDVDAEDGVGSLRTGREDRSLRARSREPKIYAKDEEQEVKDPFQAPYLLVTLDNMADRKRL